MTRYLGLFVTCAVLGCAGTTQEQPVSSVTMTSAIVAAEIESYRTPRIEPKPVERFADDQILGLLTMFNKGEIDIASLAQDRSRNPSVLRFATLLQKDHSSAREAEARLSERLVMRPASTDKMREMQADAQKETDKLRGLSGHDFDVEFVSNQVDRQRDCLAMIDVEFVPSARLPEIRAHLTTFRQDVDHHLRDGEELKRTIGGPFIASTTR